MSLDKEGGRKKMAAETMKLKPLKGKDADKFIIAFETSALKKDGVKKAIDMMKKGFDVK